MNKNKYNPYENMLAVLDEAASRLGLKEADYKPCAIRSVR